MPHSSARASGQFSGDGAFGFLSIAMLASAALDDLLAFFAASATGVLVTGVKAERFHGPPKAVFMMNRTPSANSASH